MANQESLKPVVLIADNKSGLSRKFSSLDQGRAAYNYFVPQGDETYHGICQSILEMYEGDDSIGEYVDKVIDFVVGEVEFRHKDTKVVEMLETWYKDINLDYMNVLPSGDTLNEWIVKSLLLTNMSCVSCENGWGTLRHGKNKTANLPVLMTVYPSTKIRLSAVGEKLGQEKTELGFVPIDFTNKGNKPTKTVENAQKFTTLNPDDTICIKAGWTPLDRSLYPSPFLKRLMKVITLRNRLIDGDLSVVEDLIMAFNWFEIDVPSDKAGKYKFQDSKNPDGSSKQDGMVKTLAGIVANKQKYLSFVLPPGWKFKKDEVKLDALINSVKYEFTNDAVMHAFGFMTLPGRMVPEIVTFNIKRFEVLVKRYRRYIELFYYQLFDTINKRNPMLFKGELPTIAFSPLRLDSDAFLNQVASLWVKGKVSDTSALGIFGFDYETEVENRKMEEPNDDIFIPKLTNPQTANDEPGIDNSGGTGRPAGNPEVKPRDKNVIGVSKKGVVKQLGKMK